VATSGHITQPDLSLATIPIVFLNSKSISCSIASCHTAPNEIYMQGCSNLA
jgi:hypothetical protein